MPKVLVIEDEAPIRENLQRFLRFEGYEVVAAENGAHGLELARSALPDLILCDVMMPELTGFQVLDALLRDSDWRRVPFVFLTASAEKDSIERGVEMGALAYVTKPFDLIELAGKLRQWLDARQP